MQDKTVLVAEVIAPIPGTVMCWVLGVDPVHVPRVRAWAGAISDHGNRRRSKRRRSLLDRVLGRPPRRRGKRRPEPGDPFEECVAFLGRHFDAALKRPTGGSVADALTEQRRRGALGRDELIDLGLLMFLAGTETTVDWMGSAALILLRDPALRRRLRDEPDLREPFAEEVLRYESPVQRRPRFATRDTTLGGDPIPAGARLEVCVGSANRDARDGVPAPGVIDTISFSSFQAYLGVPG